jgi:hypothetical protein
MLEGMATCGSKATDSAGPSKGSSPNGLAPGGTILLIERTRTWRCRTVGSAPTSSSGHYVGSPKRSATTLGSGSPTTSPASSPRGGGGNRPSATPGRGGRVGVRPRDATRPRGARRAARLPAAPARRRGTFRSSAPSSPTCTGGGTGGEGCRPSACWSSPAYSGTRSGRYGWARCRSGAGSTRNRPTRSSNATCPAPSPTTTSTSTSSPTGCAHRSRAGRSVAPAGRVSREPAWRGDRRRRGGLPPRHGQYPAVPARFRVAAAAPAEPPPLDVEDIDRFLGTAASAYRVQNPPAR